MFRINSLAPILATCALTGCVPGQHGYAQLNMGGLSFDQVSRSFHGVDPTSSADLPTTGTASYSGRYVDAPSSVTTTPTGDVAVGLDFAGDDVTFDLQNSLIGSVNGALSVNGSGRATITGSDGNGFSFSGSLYGENADVIAGEFYSSYCPVGMACAAVIIPGYFAATKL